MKQKKHKAILRESKEDIENFGPSKYQIFIKVFGVIAGIEFFVGLSLIGCFGDKQWIAIIIACAGIGVLFIIYIIERIIRLVIFLQHPKENIENNDIVIAVKEIGSHYKHSYKKASKKQRVKFILMISPFFISIISMLIGVFFANNISDYKIVGFVLMGVSFGTMFIWIFSLVIYSKIKERKSLNKF